MANSNHQIKKNKIKTSTEDKVTKRRKCEVDSECAGDNFENDEFSSFSDTEQSSEISFEIESSGESDSSAEPKTLKVNSKEDWIKIEEITKGLLTKHNDDLKDEFINDIEFLLSSFENSVKAIWNKNSTKETIKFSEKIIDQIITHYLPFLLKERAKTKNKTNKFNQSLEHHSETFFKLTVKYLRVKASEKNKTALIALLETLKSNKLSELLPDSASEELCLSIANTLTGLIALNREVCCRSLAILKCLLLKFKNHKKLLKKVVKRSFAIFEKTLQNIRSDNDDFQSLIKELCKLYLINSETTYGVAYRFLDRAAKEINVSVANTTKKGIKSNASKGSQKDKIVSWKFVNSLILWERFIVSSGIYKKNNKPESDKVALLVYPFVSVVNSALTAFSTPNHIPFRMQLIRVLLRILRSSKGKLYIPLAPHLLPILSCYSRKNPRAQFDESFGEIENALVLKNSDLKKHLDVILTECINLMEQYFKIYSHLKALPEISFAVLERLKSLRNEIHHPEFKSRVSSLVEKLNLIPKPKENKSSDLKTIMLKNKDSVKRKNKTKEEKPLTETVKKMRKKTNNKENSDDESFSDDLIKAIESKT